MDSAQAGRQVTLSDLKILIFVLVGITLIYQIRPFVSEWQFAYISVPAYSIIPGFWSVISFVAAIKLRRRKDPVQTKAFVLFALGATSWFIAEQIWAIYDHLLLQDPFPSWADVFYISAYPFMVGFLYYNLKRFKRSITKYSVAFSATVSFSFVIPSLLASYDSLVVGSRAFEIGIAFAYPIASSILLFPTVIGVLAFFKKRSYASNFWLFLLFGFILYVVSDTIFLFVVIDESYYDGHPVDLLFLYSFILLTFAVLYKLKHPEEDSVKEDVDEHMRFETINRFAIPMTLVFVILIVSISLIHLFFFAASDFSFNTVTIGIFAMLGVFSTIVLLINKNLSKLVNMKTRELEEQKLNLERLVEQKSKDLVKSERFSVIGQLSGRVAHDIRNPLSVIKMSIDLLKRNSDRKVSDKYVTEKLNLIENSLARISHQVDDVLGFVRESKLNLSNVWTNDLIQNTVSRMNIPSNVKINVSKTNNLELVCDPLKIEAVLSNIILNAIQALGDQNGEIWINCKKQNDNNTENTVIEIKNSGPPIPDSVINDIFEPLFTTKSYGTGLGLSSCNNIIKQHNGKILVSNNPTTFSIMIPKL